MKATTPGRLVSAVRPRKGLSILMASVCSTLFVPFFCAHGVSTPLPSDHTVGFQTLYNKPKTDGQQDLGSQVFFVSQTGSDDSDFVGGFGSLDGFEERGTAKGESSTDSSTEHSSTAASAVDGNSLALQQTHFAASTELNDDEITQAFGKVVHDQQQASELNDEQPAPTETRSTPKEESHHRVSAEEPEKILFADRKGRADLSETTEQSSRPVAIDPQLLVHHASGQASLDNELIDSFVSDLDDDLSSAQVRQTQTELTDKKETSEPKVTATEAGPAQSAKTEVLPTPSSTTEKKPATQGTPLQKMLEDFKTAANKVESEAKSAKQDDLTVTEKQASQTQAQATPKPTPTASSESDRKERIEQSGGFVGPVQGKQEQRPDSTQSAPKPDAKPVLTTEKQPTTQATSFKKLLEEYKAAADKGESEAKSAKQDDLTVSEVGDTAAPASGTYGDKGTLTDTAVSDSPAAQKEPSAEKEQAGTATGEHAEQSADDKKENASSKWEKDIKNLHRILWTGPATEIHVDADADADADTKAPAASAFDPKPLSQLLGATADVRNATTSRLFAGHHQIISDFRRQIRADKAACVSTPQTAVVQPSDKESFDTARRYSYIRGYGSRSHVKSDSNRVGYNDTGFDFEAGLIFKLDPDRLLGVFLSGQEHKTDLHDRAGDFTTDGLRLGSFFSRQYEQFHIDGAVSLGFHDVTARSKESSSTTPYRGHLRSDDWTAWLGTGYDFSLAQLTLTPMAEYLYIDTAESEAHLNRADGSRIGTERKRRYDEISRLGLKGSYALAGPSNTVLRAGAGWQHTSVEDAYLRPVGSYSEKGISVPQNKGWDRWASVGVSSQPTASSVVSFDVEQHQKGSVAASASYQHRFSL